MNLYIYFRMLLNSDEHPKAMTKQFNPLQQSFEKCQRCCSNTWGKLHKVLVTQLSFESLMHWYCMSPSLPAFLPPFLSQCNLSHISSNSAQFCAFWKGTSSRFLTISCPILKYFEFSNTKETIQIELLSILSTLTMVWTKRASNHILFIVSL